MYICIMHYALCIMHYAYALCIMHMHMHYALCSIHMDMIMHLHQKLQKMTNLLRFTRDQWHIDIDNRQ